MVIALIKQRSSVRIRPTGLESKPAVRAMDAKDSCPSPFVRVMGTKRLMSKPICAGYWAKKKTNRHQETSRAGTRQRPDAGKEKRWILQKQQE